MFTLGLVIGIFIGSVATVFCMALAAAASTRDGEENDFNGSN